MPSSQEEFLSLFGWDDFFESHILDTKLSSLIPARVICEERNLYRLQMGINQSLWATVSGKIQFNAFMRADYPAVGDWVMVEIPPQSDRKIFGGCQRSGFGACDSFS